MGGVLDRLREAIDDVLDAGLSDSESVVELHRQLARLVRGRRRPSAGGTLIVGGRPMVPAPRRRG